MNILFLSLLDFESLHDSNIYTDLLREFTKNGHYIYTISPVERRQNKKTYLKQEGNASILKLRIGNTQKTSFIEKGISTIMLGYRFRMGIQKYFSDVKFDLILYSTPPITLVGTIKYVKRKTGAKTYLMLKDIFPQNAVDIGMLSKNGLRGLLYKYFRRQEKELYRISDRIGCMSPANIDYVLKHNLEVLPEKVEICPNCIDVIDKSVDKTARRAIREKYGIPVDKKVFIYGGNLGKPQGIPFIIECLKRVKDIQEAFFVIVGDGTEYGILAEYVNGAKQKNLKLMNRLPKIDYDTMVGACDVGMIFLDHRFTIPNFPSRMLSYMQSKLPILAVTDPNTDIGKIIVTGEFGWWCESDDASKFVNVINKILHQDIMEQGFNSYQYLVNNYSVCKNVCKLIMR